MNPIDEEEYEYNTGTLARETTVDQFPSVQSPPICISKSNYSSKQTRKKDDRSKYQRTNRPSSLPPARHSSSSLNQNINKETKERRRYASDSNTNNQQSTPTSLVTSFLQHLRNELRTATNDKKNDYHQYIKQKASLSLKSLKTMSSKLSNEELLEINDHNEILTLIDLLVLRVECLTNENKFNKQSQTTKDNCPTVAEVDQNLIEYLYYLFKKFVNEDTDSLNDLSTPIIDKTNFVNVCQTLVRNGCFDISSASPEQSLSETTTITNDNQTTQTFLREYHPNTDEIPLEKSQVDEQDTWLVVDLEANQTEELMQTSQTSCIIPTSTSDEQLLSLTNDHDKSFESESSPSIYLSPNTSLIDFQNMVQEYDETNNQSNSESGSTLNVTSESKTSILSNDDHQSSSFSSNNIYTSLTNDDNSIETTEQIDAMSRREKKMQERWSTATKTDNDNNNEQSSTKPLIGIEFPQISVLRRKFSSSTLTTNKKRTNTNEKDDSNSSPPNEEINTSPMTSSMDNMNPDQINELPLKDLSLSINSDVSVKNDDGQLPDTLLDEERMMKIKENPLFPPVECQTETTTNTTDELVDNQRTNNENSSIMKANLFDSNSLLLSTAFSSSPLIPISPSTSTLTLTTNENDTIEPLLNAKEEEKKEEEQQQRCNDDYNLDEEKKNNSSFVYDYHASGIILINDEPTQIALLKQEKEEKEKGEEQEEQEGEGENEEEEERERPSSPLLTLEQFNQQRIEDESPLQILSNDINQMAMTNIDENDERYKKVEIEEVPDDEEAVSTQNIDTTEPIDYIHTDDEPTKKSPPPSTNSTNTTATTNDELLKFDNVFECYEKALAKVVDTKYDETSITNQSSEQDPIALRALQRFQERMNAAATTNKTSKDDTNALLNKGKSSWSSSHSTPRKSLENLLKPSEQQLRSTDQPILLSSTTDSYIRPRKTFAENNLNYGLTSSTNEKINNNDAHKIETEQQQESQEQQPTAIKENDDKRVIDNKSMAIGNVNDKQILNETTTTTIATANNENNIQNSTVDESGITPYRFQIEGRRRLNTAERMRERRQSRESLDNNDEKEQQIRNEYNIKTEEVQDPIIRRALERFDEKNRTLTQTKSMNYDEIQDPITRRALMRLESNLKRTMPSTIANSNETSYTENYTLGSLQPTNDRVSRYTDSSLTQSPLLNNNTKYISVRQHYCTPSSNELSDISTTNDQDTSVVRVSAQPIYLTSTNQPLTSRQRSRSEDMLASKELTIGQTTNLDDMDTSSSTITGTTMATTSASQLQRNRSSNELASNESGFLLPNTLIKALEPTFVRTTESSVSYATPTQTYSAYSCEYTRPRRNLLVTSTSETPTAYRSESNSLTSSTYSQPLEQQQQNDIQRPTPYRPTQPSSAFAPIQSSTNTTTATTNYYNQQPAYNSMYSSNNLNQTSYNEDPIVRRALERFNNQMQSTMLSTSQYPSSTNYSSRQGNLHDTWMNNPNRSNLMTTSTSSGSSSGYQSIIGRRRQIRHDDPNNYFIDNPSVGDAYSSSLFSNQYTNLSDEPPVIPPRYRRTEQTTTTTLDPYRRHSTDDYLTENLNNNNNNNSSSVLNSQTLPRETYIHHAYPATITNTTGFRPINLHYTQLPLEQENFNDRAQSTTSTNSSDSLKQRSNNLRTQRIINEQVLSNNSPSDHGDAVFHRLAYTGTKASLSKSSSNLLNKVPPNQLKSCEIDFDEPINTTIIDHTTEQQIPVSSSSSTTNKYQRSKSVDTRGRLKLTQTRSNDTDENNNDDEQQKSVPSSKFTSVNTRPPPPRLPLTPRTTLTKRSTNGIQRQGSNENLYDIENEENISYNDNSYQTKLLENKMRTSIPVHRYTTNNNNNTNNIQTSPSTSSINSNITRPKPPTSLDRRDSNGSITDSNRTSRRSDDNRLVSPNGQRRNIPVSVFSPAKLDNKRPAPAPPTYNHESQQQPTAYLSRLSTNEPDTSNKKPSGNLLSDYSNSTDKHDNTKKMNVFERLFRGNKKKN